jgi:hypothetical protein
MTSTGRANATQQQIADAIAAERTTVRVIFLSVQYVNSYVYLFAAAADSFFWQGL